jgi:hypothetical protein
LIDVKRFVICVAALLVVVLLIPALIDWVSPDKVENVCPFAVKIDGQVYLTRMDSTDLRPEDGQITGYIESSVPISQMPEENDQANWDCVGQPYAVIDGEVFLRDKGGIWYTCKPSETTRQ